MLDQQLRKDIHIILDYLWQDEKKHYQENPSRDHIYSVLRRVAKNTEYDDKNKVCFVRRLT